MLNRVFVVGRLTKDPEIRILPTGNKVAEFSIAFNRNYRDKATNEWKSEAHYFDVRLWGSAIDRLDKVQKGTSVLLEGSLVQDRWVSQDGRKQSRVVISATSIRIVSQPTQQSGTSDTADNSINETDALSDIHENVDLFTEDDDIPF